MPPEAIQLVGKTNAAATQKGWISIQTMQST
jgi:hypothetical protein